MISPLLKCGCCGCDKFFLYEGERIRGFYSKCIECESITEFCVAPSYFTISFPRGGYKSEGIACVFPLNKEYLGIPNEEI